MKKTLLLLCIATLGLASCKKETFVQNFPNKTIITYIEPSQWQTDGYTYYNLIDLSDVLDEPTFEYDGILVYISRGDNDSYEQIPNVYDLDSYSYLVDKINRSLEIDIQRSDYANALPSRPGSTTRVKIVLVRSQE